MDFMASSGDDSMINKDKELMRREHEEIISSSIYPDIFLESDQYSNLTLVEKWREYSLAFINKKFDKELYDILQILHQIVWHPSSYQVSTDEELVNDISEEKSKFFDIPFATITAADIITYFACEIVANVGKAISTASACEILLRNLGVYPNPGDDYIIKKAWNDFCRSNELPFKTTIFDQSYYDICCTVYVDGTYNIPSWKDQCKMYASILYPGGWNLDK